MSDFAKVSDELMLARMSLAVTELAKGMKIVSFYPANHPILIQAITKISTLFEEIPLPEQGLEITVTKNHLLHDNSPLQGSGSNKSLVDLNRELYLRRAAGVIFFPGIMPDEIVSFLKAVSRDVAQLLDAGGLKRVLRKEGISRISINPFEYDKLADLLKEDEEEEEEADEEPGDNFFQKPDEPDLQQDYEVFKEAPNANYLLARIEKETDPIRYRDHIAVFNNFMALEQKPAQRIEYSTRAVSIFIRHVESPPERKQEIADLAAKGIRELINDDLIDHYITQLKTGGIRGRQETETILAAFGENVVDPLLQALAEEKDILLRKAIVSIVVRIGRTAIPAILSNLYDPRWYMVRNMVTILGSLNMPDLAPQIMTALSNPDIRVKKEAIKALSKFNLTSTTTTLCDLCFHPDESVALAATAALSTKKEQEVIVTLFRRVTTKKFFQPNYRLAHEAIDSLRAIGSEEAAIALEQILLLNTFWKTEKFHAMKTHALRSLISIKGSNFAESLRDILQGNDKTLYDEAQRILKRTTE